MPRTFIDHLNHEVRSPLTVVVGMAELLSLSSLSVEQRQHLGVLRQATNSILRLMDLAVDFNRLQSGSLALKDERFSLKAVLDQVRQPFCPHDRTPTVEIEVQPNVPDALEGDGARLRQVLAEAVSYLAEIRRIERIALRVGAEPSASPEAHLTFAFAAADRPPATAEDGLAGEFIGCSDDTVARRHGLELAVAAGLAAAMNGALWIASSADAPLVARLTAAFGLPRENAELSEAFEQPALLRPRSGKRILLAEDIRPNQQIIASLLRRRGHAVSIAEDGLEAVNVFDREAGRFDVAILDLEMPVMDGRQAAAEIRRRSTAQPVRIIALSAHGPNGGPEPLDPECFDAALGKPIDAERLFEAVESGELRPRASSACACESRADAAGEPVAVDYRAALKRLCGDEQLLDDLVQFFLDDSPELLCEARAAIARRDARALERTAHSIRGLASNFGAQQTMLAAEALEEIGRSVAWEAAEKTCQALELEVNRLTAVLKDRIQRTRPAGAGARKA